MSDKSPEWKTKSDFFNLGVIIANEEVVTLNFYNQAARTQYALQTSRTVWDNIVKDTKYVNISDIIVNDDNRLDNVEFPKQGS